MVSTSVEINLPTTQNGVVATRTYTKTIHLYKESEVLRMAMALDLKKSIQIDLLKVEKGSFITYNTKRTVPRIMDSNFIEKINWVNARTCAGLAVQPRRGRTVPCAHCGNFPSEMHHLKHVRMRKFSELVGYPAL